MVRRNIFVRRTIIYDVARKPVLAGLEGPRIMDLGFRYD